MKISVNWQIDEGKAHPISVPYLPPKVTPGGN